MDAETILDRYDDAEVAELEKYFFYTISGRWMPHHPVRIASLLLRLTPTERDCLSLWAEDHFSQLALEMEENVARVA